MRDRAIGSGVKRRQSSSGEIDITTSDKNPAEAGFFLQVKPEVRQF